MQRRQPTSICRSAAFRPQSSDTRRPVEYSSSIMALSRRPSGGVDVGLGEQAVHFRDAQKFREGLAEFRGLRRWRPGSSLMIPSVKAKRKKWRMVTRWRATERLSSLREIERAQEIHDVAVLDIAPASSLAWRQTPRIWPCRGGRRGGYSARGLFRLAGNSRMIECALPIHSS